ncbi:hypothetical protein [Streptomyces sp. NPDC092370]|uniref:hypothetical protein n=1 Tax=Streptomyces sp. NPDC092370 TaxID=3366016 RepID=UPI003828FF6E
MSHRLGFRKRPALVAASSLAVVTLSAVLVVNLGGGDFPDDRPSGASHTRSAASRASHGPAVASPSSSPSARPSRSSASQTPKARPSTSVSGGATVAPDRAENTTPDRGPAPLTVSVRAHAWKSPCDASYLVDRPPTEVPQPPLAQDAQGWAGEVGAVPAGEQRVALTVQGTGEQAVVIESLYVRVVDSEAPLAWNAYDMGDGCGGGVATRPFGVDLDAARPTVVPRKGQRGFPYSVSRSDPEVLSITAHTGSRYVRWYLELQWSSGGRQGTMQISDQSEPFRTSAMTGRPRYGYPIGGTAWFKREE